MNIYCISGLGADHQIFDKLILPNNIVLKHIRWIKQLPNESIVSYAHRMSDRIKEDNPIIMGVSFGGMIAVEIAKFRSLREIILISSIKTTYERPFYFKAVATLHLNKIFRVRPMRIIDGIENFTLGVKSVEDKTLARSYRRKFDGQYVDWALDRIVHWKNTEYPKNMFQIHGTADHVLPFKYVNADYPIEGGGHLMVFNHAREVSEAIVKGLKRDGIL